MNLLQGKSDLGRETSYCLSRIEKRSAFNFLLIEHDLETVMNISDRVIVMADGKIIADGLPNSIYENELVVDAYLGSRRKES